MNATQRLSRGIYKRGNVYWLAVQKEKKRHYISLKTSDLSEAIRNAARLRHSPALESGSLIRHAVDRFVDYMRLRREAGESGGWARATLGSKNYVLITFASWCGNIRPADVTPDRMRKYYNLRLANTSAATAFGNLMTIRSFFNWCRDVEKTIRENPCAVLRITAPDSAARKDFCSPELVARIIDECERDDMKFVYYCGFHAGLRALEIVEARPFWFDLKAGILHLRKTPTMQFKDREERSIPLTGKFLAFIRDDYGLREPFMLHPENQHGKNRYRYDFTRPFREWMLRQGCPWVTPHTMRHSFASLLASDNHSIFKIATYLGDDVRVVQRHYAKLLPEAGALDSAFHVPSSSKPSKASQAASKAKRS
jgi:integrase